MTDRSRARRAKALTGRLTQPCDLPVHSPYLNECRRIVKGRERHVSRWLNAVSFNLSASQAELLRELPFVKSVQPVRRFVRTYENRLEIDQAELENQDNPPRRDYDLEYGGSLRQNLFLNVPELHDRGFTGRGVLVGILDAGFNNLDHNCFRHLDVVATWDFVNDDENVANEDDMGRGDHGTKVLSIIAGFDPGLMIGMAFGASYLLAKTENTDWERQVEEDHWVAGIEWMDGFGVEVVSSSLSYLDWYRYEDMDGNTGVTTIAADIAVGLGIVVVTSIGNSGMNRYPMDKMGAPADGDSVFAIGATDRDSTYAPFSSRGPTFDGRIKPDFTTIGMGVRFASDIRDDGYGAGLGTSFSAPAIAGLCALIIEANPYHTPMSLRDLLRDVSTHREQPDTLFGWGIPDGLAALNEGGLPNSELTITLRNGWNIISHNLALGQLDIRDVFAPLVENDLLAMVKDGQGRFYIPHLLFNNIPAWVPEEGYQVKVQDDTQLLLDGVLRNYREPMELERGWQFVAYTPNFRLNVEEAMASLTRVDALEIVKNERGRFYLPAWEFSNMEPLEPGRGYHLKLTAAVPLTYPRRQIVRYEAQHPDPMTELDPTETGMSLLILAGAGVQDGDLISCANPMGEVVGKGVVRGGRCGVAVWGGDEPWQPIVVDVSAGMERSETTVQVTWLQGSSLYQPNGIAVAEVAAFPLSLINSSLKLSAFPNPGNALFEISLYSDGPGALSVKIYDSAGRVRSASSAHAKAGGQIRIPVRLDGWASGVYIAEVSDGTRRGRVKLLHTP